MTKQEKIIVSAYTGVLMCDFDDVHEYIQKKFGRPVFTHELADKDIQKEVEEKSKEDFLKICSREETERKKGWWLIREGISDAQCSECKMYFRDVYDMDNEDAFCRHCGAKMEGLKVVKNG